MDRKAFSERSEAFVTDLYRESYMVGAGLKEQLEVAAIYQRYADLFDRKLAGCPSLIPRYSSI